MPGPSALTHAADPVVIIPVAHSLSNLLSKYVRSIMKLIAPIAIVIQTPVKIVVTQRMLLNDVLRSPVNLLIEIVWEITVDVVVHNAKEVNVLKIVFKRVVVKLHHNLPIINVLVPVAKLIQLKKIVPVLKTQHQIVTFLKE